MHIKFCTIWQLFCKHIILICCNGLLCGHVDTYYIIRLITGGGSSHTPRHYGDIHNHAGMRNRPPFRGATPGRGQPRFHHNGHGGRFKATPRPYFRRRGGYQHGHRPRWSGPIERKTSAKHNSPSWSGVSNSPR